jgi:hypothetical protein
MNICHPTLQINLTLEQVRGWGPHGLALYSVSSNVTDEQTVPERFVLYFNMGVQFKIIQNLEVKFSSSAALWKFINFSSVLAAFL